MAVLGLKPMGTLFYHGDNGMVDLLYIVLTLVFLFISWGFVVFCDRLMDEKK
jgi:hypothetical protein